MSAQVIDFYQEVRRTPTRPMEPRDEPCIIILLPTVPIERCDSKAKRPVLPNPALDEVKPW